jgi:hypothetical protein
MVSGAEGQHVRMASGAEGQQPAVAPAGQPATASAKQAPSASKHRPVKSVASVQPTQAKPVHRVSTMVAIPLPNKELKSGLCNGFNECSSLQKRREQG